MEDSKELPVVGDIVSLSMNASPNHIFNKMKLIKDEDGFQLLDDVSGGNSSHHVCISDLMKSHREWHYIYITHDGVKRCYQKPVPQVMRVIKD